ncbi:MAG: TIGR04255 family protein [Candidatus Poribacteria bacterium]|nr:TIGR04255 family protein [Candidatus Poribacteria bacterium]
MNFKESGRVEYECNILFELLCQVRFPEIMRISQEQPAEFQDIVRKEGYPEFESEVPVFPSDIPKELKEMIPIGKTFHFLSEERDLKVSLANNFIAFTCNGNYINYADFREKLENVLQIFSRIYEPSYFTRIGLRHKNVANRTSVPLVERGVEAFIPEHIFPELATSIATDIETLQKVALFNDGNTKANVTHVLSEVSGRFRKKEFNEKSYIIDVDCFVESRIEGINNVLTKCDLFKQLNWNIFQWSITDELRKAMGKSES